jgi:toxin-antitoxin system PIN domain toxin
LLTRVALGIPWISLWAFIRIVTNPRITQSPLSLEDAFEIAREILSMPGVILVQPGPKHLQILEQLSLDVEARGPRLTDAVLAAIAIETGAALASTDRDFARFKQLNWINPAA